MYFLLRSLRRALPVVVVVLSSAPFAILAVYLRGLAAGLPRRAALRRSLLDVSLAVWLSLLFVITLIPLHADRMVDLVPTSGLVGILRAGHGVPELLAGIAGNMLLFLPLGLLAPLRWRWLHRVGRLTVVAAVLSVAIESLQFLLDIGRTTSTDDVWLNTAGAVLGLLVTRWRRRAPGTPPPKAGLESGHSR
jgi:glycopeptide antibiotics resistance protein